MHALEATPEVETSSETLALTATLLLLKSQKLIPQEKIDSGIEEDSRIEMIQSLIEYCQLKEAAKTLLLREEEQKAHFPRATPPFQKELCSGLEDIGIENLKNLLFNVLKRSSHDLQQVIKEEEWQVSHKLAWLREILNAQKKILFSHHFSTNKSRIELIVLFLALLEMMKHQEVSVVKENGDIYITSYDTRT